MTSNNLELAMNSVQMGAGPLYRDKTQMTADSGENLVNTSGLEAVGRAVLVKPYEKSLSTGVIEIPSLVQERHDMVQQRAVVIHIGENCWHDEPSPRAKVGDHVLITKFAGFIAGPDMTADKQTYRIVNDRDIFTRIVGGRNG